MAGDREGWWRVRYQQRLDWIERLAIGASGLVALIFAAGLTWFGLGLVFG